MRNSTKIENKEQNKTLLMSRILFNLFLYFFILRSAVSVFLPSLFLACALALSFLFFVYALNQARSSMPGPFYTDHFLFELIGLGAAFFSLQPRHQPRVGIDAASAYISD